MIRTYARPATMDEALDLLSDPDAAILAGGTDFNGDAAGAPSVAVDLQDLGLDVLEADGSLLRIGAMTTLQALADASTTPALLRELALLEAPNTIRNAATVGGTIGTADPESELLAGLVLFDAVVTLIRKGGSIEVSLDDLLDDPSMLAESVMTSIAVARGGGGAAERTGRTPKDRPIVMVAGRSADDGTTLLVATGVAARPMSIDVTTLDQLEPPSDFRGSTAYRRHLVEVLSGRVTQQLKGGAA
jgi:CO/xanthine dehydrogenase FAD-binding subunit